VANELIRPFDPDTAHAIEELAKTASKGLEVVEKAGGYAANVVGRTPHDFLGFLFGDRLFHWRLRQLAALQQKTRKILTDRGVKEDEQNPSVEIPLLEAAIDEGREELVTIWAKLWAAAMDPSRKSIVRRSLIDVVKKLEPIDAVLFNLCAQELGEPNSTSSPLISFVFGSRLPYERDDLTISIDALKNLNLISETAATGAGRVTSLGRMLARAVID
jgi:hypothetical protein